MTWNPPYSLYLNGTNDILNIRNKGENRLMESAVTSGGNFKGGLQPIRGRANYPSVVSVDEVKSHQSSN